MGIQARPVAREKPRFPDIGGLERNGTLPRIGSHAQARPNNHRVPAAQSFIVI